jgi:uncharacterized membrane protein
MKIICKNGVENMKKYFKDLLAIIIPLAVCLVIYPFLPDQIPRSFHLDGTRSYMPKEFIFLLGLIPYLIYLKAGKQR